MLRIDLSLSEYKAWKSHVRRLCEARNDYAEFAQDLRELQAEEHPNAWFPRQKMSGDQTRSRAIESLLRVGAKLMKFNRLYDKWLEVTSSAPSDLAPTAATWRDQPWKSPPSLGPSTVKPSSES